MSKLDQYGIELDPWSEGLDHHPESIRLFKELEDLDWKEYGDYFCWKSGGDGDNGETLMYQLDIIFRRREKLYGKIY